MRLIVAVVAWSVSLSVCVSVYLLVMRAKTADAVRFGCGLVGTNEPKFLARPGP